jgi:hypothetical protein
MEKSPREASASAFIIATVIFSLMLLHMLASSAEQSFANETIDSQRVAVGIE